MEGSSGSSCGCEGRVDEEDGALKREFKEWCREIQR
jgi:hypothetical protein